MMAFSTLQPNSYERQKSTESVYLLQLTTSMSPTAASKWIVFALMATGILMSTLDSNIVNVALLVIISDLSISLSVIKWVVMIYFLTISSLLLTFGRLSDL